MIDKHNTKKVGNASVITGNYQYYDLSSPASLNLKFTEHWTYKQIVKRIIAATTEV